MVCYLVKMSVNTQDDSLGFVWKKIEAWNGVMFAGAPRAMLDAFTSEVKANEGEPFKVRVPFRGSPTPEATWFNVSMGAVISGH